MTEGCEKNCHLERRNAFMLFTKLPVKSKLSNATLQKHVIRQRLRGLEKQIHRLHSDVIPMPAGFRRHLVGMTLINVSRCNIAEIRFVGKLVIIQTFS